MLSNCAHPVDCMEYLLLDKSLAQLQTEPAFGETRQSSLFVLEFTAYKLINLNIFFVHCLSSLQQASVHRLDCRLSTPKSAYFIRYRKHDEVSPPNTDNLRRTA